MVDLFLADGVKVGLFLTIFPIFKDSLLALANTNICQDSINFNCFPNLSKDLEDPYFLKSKHKYLQRYPI